MSIYASQPFGYQSMTGLIVGTGTSIDFTNLTVETLNYLTALLFNGNPITTDQVIEGLMNLYFTNARARAAISTSNTIGASGITFTYNMATGVISATILNSQVTISSHVLQLGGTLNLVSSDVGLGNVANALQLIAANNLSDLTNVSTAQTNIGAGTAVWNANQLQGIPIDSTAPISGQLLTYNGTKWIPGSDDSGHDAEFIWTRAIHDSVPTVDQILMWNNGSSYWNYSRIDGQQIYDDSLSNAGKPHFNTVNIGGSSIDAFTGLTQVLQGSRDRLFIGNSGVGNISLQGNDGSGNFNPTYVNTCSSSNITQTYFDSIISTDTGTQPVMTWTVENSNNSAIATRPLFTWQNYTTEVMRLKTTGELTVPFKMTTTTFSTITPTSNNVVPFTVLGFGGGDQLSVLLLQGSGQTDATNIVLRAITYNDTKSGFSINSYSADSAGNSSPGITINVFNSFSSAIANVDVMQIKNGSNVWAKIDKVGNIIGGSTTGAIIDNSLTTTQRNALSAINGQTIYNSTLGLFEIYNNKWRPSDKQYSYIRKVSTQSINSGSNTTVTSFDSSYNVNSNFFTNSTVNGTITVLVGGLYQLSANFFFAASILGTRYMYIFKNGSGFAVANFPGNNQGNEAYLCKYPFVCSANDVFSLVVYQDTGLALNFGSVNEQSAVFLMAELIDYT